MEKENKVVEEKTTDNVDEKASADQEQQSSDEKKYTDEDVNRIIDARFARWEAQKNAELEEERKKAKMDAEQLRNYEAEQKDKQLAEYEAKLNHMTLTTVATKSLSDKGYVPSDELLGFVIRDDETKTLQAIDAFNALVEKEINARLKENARQNTPKTGQQFTGSSSFDVKKFAEENRIIKE